MGDLVRYAPILFTGAFVTIALAFASLLLATALGALGAAGKLSGSRVWYGVALGYTTLVRGVPDIVMLLLVYYGGQRLLNVALGVFGIPSVDLPPFLAGVLSIGFLYGAYLSETFRGAYLAVPRGQLDAGRALGLHPFAVFWNVMLPQLIRYALPGYGNVWQVLM